MPLLPIETQGAGMIAISKLIHNDKARTVTILDKRRELISADVVARQYGQIIANAGIPGIAFALYIKTTPDGNQSYEVCRPGIEFVKTVNGVTSLYTVQGYKNFGTGYVWRQVF